MSLHIINQIRNLCADELAEIYSILHKTIDDKVGSKDSNHEIIKRERHHALTCPHCGSPQFNKNGKTKLKRQKYRCKHCLTSFSDTTKTIVSRSKKSFDVWKRYIDCEMKHLTLSAIADELGISKTCAFNWRHKFHKALENYVNTMKLTGEIQLDAIYMNINLKGTKPENMPRFSKKRSSSAYRGLSHHKVCILSGIDQLDHMVIKIAGLGKETIQYYHVLDDNIEHPELLITDQAWGFTTYSKEMNCKLEQIPTTTYKTQSGKSLAEINALHSHLRTYLKVYRGVSIRHLQGYLNTFIYFKTLRYQYEYDYRVRQAYIKAIPSETIFLNKEISKSKLPIDLNIAYGEYRYKYNA